MSIEHLLNFSVDNEAIQHYLHSLAQREVNVEQRNTQLTEKLHLCEQAVIEANKTLHATREEANHQLLLCQQKLTNALDDLDETEQQLVRLEVDVYELKTQINNINAELNQLRPRSVERFVVRSDGTATDTSTGLMWCRFSIGQQWHNNEVIGNASKMDWFSAMKVASYFNKQGVCGGFSDWRLPSLKELQSLIEIEKSPSINLSVFPNTPKERFWSSSKPSNLAFFVFFKDGSSNGTYENREYAVRLVR